MRMCSFLVVNTAHALVNNMESTLTPDDAVDVLEELLPAQNKAYELGLKLKLPQERVEGIQRLYSEPRQQLLHILVEFTNQEEPRPTRKTIVEALKSPAIDLPALARKIEASHVRKNSATGEPPLSPLSDQSGEDTPSLHFISTHFILILIVNHKTKLKLISENVHESIILTRSGRNRFWWSSLFAG